MLESSESLFILVLLCTHKHTPVSSDASREKMIGLMKACSKNGLILNWMNEKSFDKHFTLVILTHTENIPNKTISIDQQVYFLTSKFELFEKYNINNIVTLQKRVYIYS